MYWRKDKMKFFTYEMYILDNQIFYSSSPAADMWIIVWSLKLLALHDLSLQSGIEYIGLQSAG